MKIYYYIIIASLTIILGCRNYDSDFYVKKENEALQQLIPQLIDLNEMLQMNDFGEGKPTLYLLAELHTEIELGSALEEKVLETENGLPKTIELIESEKYKVKKKHFKPFINGSIKNRKLTTEFKYPNLHIKLISKDELESTHTDIAEAMKRNKEIFGYLSMTRIVMNKDFDTGYMSYAFFCGKGCVWGSNIEVKIKNGQWQVIR